jgi:hypothetical protein
MNKASNFNKEWKDRLVKEMLRFNGKSLGIGEGTESISDMTTETRKGYGGGAGRPRSALKSSG